MLDAVQMKSEHRRRPRASAVRRGFGVKIPMKPSMSMLRAAHDGVLRGAQWTVVHGKD